jgi:hypothetical protein
VTTLPADDGAQRNAELERLRRLFRFFAATQCRGNSLVYETLSMGVADDDSLLDLLMRTPSEQRRPSLLFAAVNHLLAAYPGAALADYYPMHGGRRPVDGQVLKVFAAFCAEHSAELGLLLRTRSTQTNEIRRCAALRLGLGHVAKRWPGPVAVAEVGASAGLNLLFDGYRYRVGDQGVAPAQDADQPGASPVLIVSELRGGATAAAVLGPVPEITARLGIDQEPVRLSDPAQRAWLEAFIWPEDVGSLATLRGPDGHEDSLLALADPYLRWLAPARHPSDDFEWLSA